METVAFIAPMRIEIKPFLARVGNPRRERLAGLPCYRFALAGWECGLVLCGIGARSAARATKIALSELHPRLAVSFGIAGAATPGLSVGDVVAVHSVRAAEAGASGVAHTLAPWSRPALEAAGRAVAAAGAGVFAGTAVTTQGGKDSAPETAGTDCVVLEMETAAISREADARGVPLLVMRSISDTPEEPLPFDVERALDAEGHVKTLAILIRILSEPGLIGRLARLARNTTAATRNLAAALTAALPVELAARA